MQFSDKDYKTLSRELFRKLVIFVCRNSGTEDDAKDLTQEVMLLYWKKDIAEKKKAIEDSSYTPRKIANEMGYLYSMGRNLWYKELERRKISPQFSYDIEIDIFDKFAEEEDSYKTTLIKVLRTSLSELGEDCRTLIKLFYYDQISMQDIAEKMGFGNSRVAISTKSRCWKRLKERAYYELETQLNGF